jgi:site-specific DNA-methyltransferase (adenine-specific)
VTAPKPYWASEDGRIVLYHGDCRDILPSLQADVIITDPDYGVGIDFGKRRQRGQAPHALAGRYRGAVALTSPEAIALAIDGLTLCPPRKGYAVCFWAAEWWRMQEFVDACCEAGLDIRHVGVWYKPNGSGVSGHGIARRWEPWFWLAHDRSKRVGEWDYLPDCLNSSRVCPHMKEAVPHPTQKPEALMRKLVRFFTVEGDIVLDPFAGSGSTIVACRQLGRRAIGIDLQEQYCEMAVQRLSQAVMPLAGGGGDTRSRCCD